MFRDVGDDGRVLCVMVLPVWIGITWLGIGLYAAWIFASSYIIILGVLFYFRFRGGKWKSMRVIEGAAPSVGIEPMIEPDVQIV